jgi:YVTN family beta-propeller protein
MKKKVLYVALMMGTTLLTGCLGDDNKKNDPIEVTITEGVVVVNNGSSYNGIDGSMSFIDLRNDAIQQNVYKTANGASLGGTPNDAIVYGQKLYVVGSDENTVFVLNPKTFKEITKISTTDILGAEGGVNPRHLMAYDGKVYVSTYGNYVAEIDTLGFTMTRSFKVGSAPEGMAISTSADGKTASLYVANSDYSYGNGSISTINLSTGSITEFKNEKIRNPQQILAAGDVLFVLDWGYYDYEDGGKQKEAGVYTVYNNEVTKTIPDATGMAGAGYTIITYSNPYGSTETTYTMYNTRYGTQSAFRLSEDSEYPIISPAAIALDPNNTGYLLIASRQKDPDTGYPSYALPGYVNLYSIQNGVGKFQKSYSVGIEPHKIEFSYGIATLQW